MQSFVRRLTGVYRFRILPFAMRVLLRPGPKVGLVRLGSAYGGWWVPEDAVRHGQVAYCAGAGEDVTFDLALHAAGVDVVVFDPTPRAIAHVNRVAPDDDRFRFFDVGWWDARTALKFYAPTDPNHVSHSAVNLQGTADYFEAPVAPVAEFVERLGHDSVDLVKMDIEGAEYVVLSDLIRRGPHPRTLCVEFDQPENVRKTLNAIKELKSSGYRLRHIDGWNYTFTLQR